MNGTPILTDNDEQHRNLAQGAVRLARETMQRRADYPHDLNNITSDVAIEAACAWQMTGLLHSSYSEKDIDEIARMIAGRVATVLVMVGWTPPARLLDEPAGGAR